MSSVLSWKNALAQGYEPSLYPYASAHVPEGQYVARLDFKIWSKRAYTLSCYFTHLETDQKFQLTVYRRHSDQVYALPDGALDFRECPVSAEYLITACISEKGKAIFKQAMLCS